MLDPGWAGVVRPLSSSTAPVRGPWHYPARTKSWTASRRVRRCCQTAGLAVAEHVVDDLVHLAGGGHLRDVAGVLPATGDDAVLDRLHDGFGGVWIASTVTAAPSNGE